MQFLWCKNALKYIFSREALPRTQLGELSPLLDPVRLVKMGEVGEVFPGPATLWGPPH